MAKNRNNALIKPENITKDNAVEVLQLWLAASAMMGDMDNLTRCIMEAVRIAIEELEKNRNVVEEGVE